MFEYLHNYAELCCLHDSGTIPHVFLKLFFEPPLYPKTPPTRMWGIFGAESWKHAKRINIPISLLQRTKQTNVNDCFDDCLSVSRCHLAWIYGNVKIWWKRLVTRCQVSSCLYFCLLVLLLTFLKAIQRCSWMSGWVWGWPGRKGRFASRRIWGKQLGFEREELPLRAGWHGGAGTGSRNLFCPGPAGPTLSYKSSPYLALLVSSSEPSQHRSSCSDS